MPVYNLEFQTQVNVSPQVVYEHLSDPHHFVGLQPLLTHVDAVQFGENNGNRTVSYETVEAFRGLGIILYRNRIRVQTVFTDPPRQFDTVVHSFPNITLNVKYTFTPQEGGVLIKESMQIQVHAWLKGFVLSEAQKAQTTVLENLKKRMESRI
ncbi:MAG: SRPBCC family protein [Anaerolineales bacterium]|nr:SRPBCC family protein [Anaerolineales bacterium]